MEFKKEKVVNPKGTFKFKQFAVDQEGVAFRFGTDSILLGSWADNRNNRKIIDIGTGSGILALMCAQRNSGAEIDAIELDHNSCKCARENFEQYSQRYPLSKLNLIEGDFNTAKLDKTYDLIISNPPFFSGSLKGSNNERNIARHDDLLSIDELVSTGGQLLSEQGKIALVLPYEKMDLLPQLCKDNQLHIRRLCRIRALPEKAFNRLMIELGAEPEELIQEELTLYSGKNEYSADFKKLTAEFYL